MHHYPAGPRGEAPAHSERRSDSSNSQQVGCARRAERHAGSDGHLISGICETLRSGDAARGTHHLIDRVDVWAYRGMHAPYQRKAPHRRQRRCDAENRRDRTLPGGPKTGVAGSRVRDGCDRAKIGLRGIICEKRFLAGSSRMQKLSNVSTA